MTRSAAAAIATALLMIGSPVARAQLAPDQARYDTNKDGRLDATELAAMQAAQAPTTSTTPSGEQVTTLTPFSVDVSKDSGYFAENTLAGSRLNTNIGDLAASITVVTKQQMQDTASLDINDVFRYEAGTEGSSTYTPFVTDGRGVAKDTIAGYSLGNNGDTTTNAQSNRVRGIGAPDASLNNYPVNNRIPFDSYNVQSIEITRGPNSLLFGLGSAAGIVNQTVAQADVTKNSGEVSLRTDQNASFRTSLAINKVLVKDKLAIYGAFLYNNQQFERKPSRDLTRREYGAFTYKPFKNTIIRGFAENYINDANRPNFLTPRDFITPWFKAGRPVYDPTTRMITLLDGGATKGPYVSSTQSDGYVAGNLTGAGVPSTLFLGTSAAFPVPNTNPNPQFVQGIQFEDTGRPVRLINGGGTVDYFARNALVAGVNYPTAQTNPATATTTLANLGWVQGDPRYSIMDRQWSSSTYTIPVSVVNNLTYATVNGVPYGTYNLPGVTNKSIYDWTKSNLAQTNFGHTRAANYNLEIEQQITPNLFFSAGWLRQDIDEVDNYTMGQLTGATVQVDTNVKLPDGRVNPYLGLPFVSEGVGGGMDTFYSPQTDDNLRAMLAYDLDLRKQPGWARFLGRHRLLGLWTTQDSKRAVERWRNGYVDGDADARLRFVPNLTLPNQQLALNGLTLMRKYYLANPGQAQGIITHGSGFYGNQGWNRPATSQIQVYNYTSGQYQNDTVVEQALFSDAGSFRTEREVRSYTLAAQSYLWNDRLITTLGWRHDKYRARITSAGVLTDVNGVVYAPALTNAQRYINGNSGLINYDAVMSRWWRWDELSGNTKTYGGAFRPLKDQKFVQSLGENSLAYEFLNGLTFYYNSSENFNPPATFQTDYFKKALPKPTGKGRDGGFGFNIIKNKLVARVNWYDTKTENERTSSAASLLTRLAYSDTTTGLAWASAVQRIRNGANTAVANWNSDTLNNVSDAANQQKIYDLIRLPLNYYSGTAIGGTQNSFAKGMELQLTFNPTSNWTIKVTGDKQKTTYKNVVPQYDAWLKERLPIWQTNAAPEIQDFVAPNAGGTNIRWSLKNFWTGYGFTNVALAENQDGNTTPQNYFNNVVANQVAGAKALEGVTAPDQRQYHASLLTNYRFSQGMLKGFSIGGSERWESKAAIGFLGKVNDPVNAPGVINFPDANRPVYDAGNYYTDIWVAYGRKIWRDKIGWKIQLNVNNATESGGIQPTAVNFDGTPYTFRIVDPRQFVLSSTFTF
jgi:hypothetical protein